MPDSVDKQGSFYGSKAQFLIPGDYTLLKTYNIIIHFCYLTLPPITKNPTTFYTLDLQQSVVT